MQKKVSRGSGKSTELNETRKEFIQLISMLFKLSNTLHEACYEMCHQNGIADDYACNLWDSNKEKCSSKNEKCFVIKWWKMLEEFEETINTVFPYSDFEKLKKDERKTILESMGYKQLSLLLDECYDKNGKLFNEIANEIDSRNTPCKSCRM